MHFNGAASGYVEVIVLLFALYLVIVIVLPVVLSAIVGIRGLPDGNACPHCAHDTFPLVSNTIALLRRIHRGFSIQRRWCPACEWDGYAHAGRMKLYACEPVEAAAPHAGSAHAGDWWPFVERDAGIVA